MGSEYGIQYKAMERLLLSIVCGDFVQVMVELFEI